MNVGEKIRKLLIELGLNQTELSHLLAVDQSTITKYMKGEREPERYLRLVIAGMTQDIKDREWWISYAEVTPKEEEALRVALRQPTPKPESDLVDAIERALAEWKSGIGPTGHKLTPISMERGFTSSAKQNYNRVTSNSERDLIDRVARAVSTGNPVVINNFTKVLKSSETLLRTGGTHDRKDAPGGRPKESPNSAGGN